MVYRSLTEQIYVELMEGAEKGLNWDELLAKYGKSKGPLYNAFSRALPQLKARYEKLVVDMREDEQRGKRIDEEVAKAEEKNRELNREIRDKEATLRKLKESEAKARENLGNYEKEIREKEALLSTVGRLEESGFSPQRLQELIEKVGETGSTHGLSFSQAVDKFFGELTRWDEKLGLEPEVQSLNLRKEDVEKKLEALEKSYQSRRAAMEALEELEERGVGMRSILLWNEIIRSAGLEAAELKREIEKWGGLREASRAEEERKKKFDEEIAKAKASLKELETRKAEIEGSIKMVTEEGTKAVKQASENAQEVIKGITPGIKEEIEGIYAQALEVGKEVAKIEKTLPAKKQVKEIFDFISSPHLLPKGHPILFSATCSLLDWVKNNEQSISVSYSIEQALENLKKELLK